MTFELQSTRTSAPCISRGFFVLRRTFADYVQLISNRIKHRRNYVLAEVNLNKVFNFYDEVQVPDSIKPFISDAEKIEFAVKTVRDVAVFTNKRILFVDRQGLTGRKVEYYSIPFKSIVTYAVETAGLLDFDSEVKLVLSGGIHIELKFWKSKHMNALLPRVFNLINRYMLA